MRRLRLRGAAAKWVEFLRDIYRDSSKNKLFEVSAALAYYAMFSIGPLLVIVVGLTGMAFGHDAVRQQIDGQLNSMFGQQVADTLDSMMTARQPGTTALTTLAGLVALVFGACGVFGQLQDSLNAIWQVKAKPVHGIWELLRRRFLSLAMVLGTGFLLLISLALTTVLAAFTERLGTHVAYLETSVKALNAVLSFCAIAALFAMIFKFLPDVRVPFSKVWVGALGTALLFEGGKHLLSLYLGREGFSSAYGAAGAVIALLTWVYYGSLILFLGAEFTKVSVTKKSGHPTVQSHARFVPGQRGVPHHVSR